MQTLNFGGGGWGICGGGGQRKPTTARNKFACSIPAVVREVIGGGSSCGQRKPRKGCEYLILLMVGVVDRCW